jgi:hypothetical protein
MADNNASLNHPSKSDFPHIQQKFNWDCGIISCQMCLRWCGRSESFDDLTRRCPTQSTWSIDLAYLLHELGLKVNSCFKSTISNMKLNLHSLALLVQHSPVSAPSRQLYLSRSYLVCLPHLMRKLSSGTRY